MALSRHTTLAGTKDKNDDHEEQERERFGVRNVVARDDAGWMGETAPNGSVALTGQLRIQTVSRCDRDRHPNSRLQAASRCERIDTPETAGSGSEAAVTTEHAANSRFTRPAPPVS